MNNDSVMDINKIISDLDSLLGRNDYNSAREFLEENVTQAMETDDPNVLFSLCNECIGLYRKINEKEFCYFYCEKVTELTERLNFNNSIPGATAFINCATAFKAFGNAEKGVPFFEKAKIIYENLLSPTDKRLAGLYNNFALTLVDLKEFDKALCLYEKAVCVLSSSEKTEPEKAISYLNMANAIEAKKGLEEACDEIDYLLDKAVNILDDTSLKQDGNYAFICEKCASTFGYYGRFVYEAQLKERAKKIYEGA